MIIHDSVDIIHEYPCLSTFIRKKSMIKDHFPWNPIIGQPGRFQYGLGMENWSEGYFEIIAL